LGPNLAHTVRAFPLFVFFGGDKPQKPEERQRLREESESESEREREREIARGFDGVFLKIVCLAFQERSCQGLKGVF